MVWEVQIEGGSGSNAQGGGTAVPGVIGAGAAGGGIAETQTGNIGGSLVGKNEADDQRVRDLFQQMLSTNEFLNSLLARIPNISMGIHFVDKNAVTFSHPVYKTIQEAVTHCTSSHAGQANVIWIAPGYNNSGDDRAYTESIQITVSSTKATQFIFWSTGRTHFNDVTLADSDLTCGAELIAPPSKPLFTISSSDSGGSTTIAFIGLQVGGQITLDSSNDNLNTVGLLFDNCNIGKQTNTWPNKGIVHLNSQMSLTDITVVNSHWESEGQSAAEFLMDGAGTKLPTHTIIRNSFMSGGLVDVNTINDTTASIDITDSTIAPQLGDNVFKGFVFEFLMHNTEVQSGNIDVGSSQQDNINTLPEGTIDISGGNRFLFNNGIILRGALGKINGNQFSSDTTLAASGTAIDIEKNGSYPCHVIVEGNVIVNYSTGINVAAGATSGSCVFGPNAYLRCAANTAGIAASENYQVHA